MVKKGYKQTEEHKRKLSLSNIGKNKGKLSWNKGKKMKPMTQEQKDKISRTMKEKGISGVVKLKKGYKQTEETKKKLSVYRKLNNPQGFKKGNKFRRKNTKHNEQTKFKISQTRKERMATGEILLSSKAGFKVGHRVLPKWIEKQKTWRKNFVLPKKDTSIEVKVQSMLKQLGIEFLTHQYMNDIEHGYQCDILIPSMNLVIECDGDYWHKYPIGNDIDHIRTKELLENGFKVLRLWEHEIKVMGLNDLSYKLGGIAPLKTV